MSSSSATAFSSQARPGPVAPDSVEGALGAGAVAGSPLEGREVERRTCALVGRCPGAVGEEPFQGGIGLLGPGLPGEGELGEPEGGARVDGRRLQRRQVGLPRPFRLPGAAHAVPLEREGGGKGRIGGQRLAGELGRAAGIPGEERDPALDHPTIGAGSGPGGGRGRGSDLTLAHRQRCPGQAGGGRDLGGSLRNVEQPLGRGRCIFVPVVRGQHRERLRAKGPGLHRVDDDERLEDLGGPAVAGPGVDAHQLARARHPLRQHLAPVVGAVEQRGGEGHDGHAGQRHHLDHP